MADYEFGDGIGGKLEVDMYPGGPSVRLNAEPVQLWYLSKIIQSHYRMMNVTDDAYKGRFLLQFAAIIDTETSAYLGIEPD